MGRPKPHCEHRLRYGLQLSVVDIADFLTSTMLLHDLGNALNIGTVE